MANPTIIVITDGSLKLAESEAGLDTGEAFTCQVTSAAINATPNLQTVPATFCAPESQAPAATGYELVASWLQDWRDPGGGLSGYTFTNDTLTKWFELKLDAADVTPVATGQVRLVAGAFGGDAGVPLPATATWPLAGKPTITMAPDAAATQAEAGEREAEAGVREAEAGAGERDNVPAGAGG
jgi:hypothetical protein